MSAFLEVKDLWKVYDKKTVLGGIDLSVQENQSVTFMGHNGSGKSTILKIIAGLVRPTKGQVHAGRKLLFHYVPERFPKMELTVAQYLDYMGKLDKLGADERRKRIRMLCEDFFMEEMLPVKLCHLSKGTLQKAGVIQALLKRPDVLLLDEPLSGQDADSQRIFLRKMQQIRKEGTTIFMACHEPFLMEQVSDVFYVLQHGRLVRAAPPAPAAQKQYEMWFEKDGGIQKQLAQENECRSVILNYLENGWEMRKMMEAGNGNIADISDAPVLEKQ